MQKSAKKSGEASTGKMLLEEIRELREAVDDLRDSVDNMGKKSVLARTAGDIVTGILRGLGFIIGTGIVAVILLFILRQAVQSDAFQQWIGTQVQDFLSDQIDKIQYQ